MTPKHAPRAARAAPLAARYADVRAASLALAAPLSAEDCQLQTMADASPTKWHLAHVTWFFETFLLERFEADFVAFDPAFRVLFNSYYQGVGAQHPRAERGLVTRPDLARVQAYRAQVDERMQSLLAARSDDAEIGSLVVLGLQHEQQHQELLLTDVKHMFSRNPLRPVYRKSWPLTTVHPNPIEWIAVPGGKHEIGFQQRLPNLQAACLEERVRHPAADQELVHPLEHALQDAKL